jgi:hypothetical protein
VKINCSNFKKISCLKSINRCPWLRLEINIILCEYIRNDHQAGTPTLRVYISFFEHPFKLRP